MINDPTITVTCDECEYTTEEMEMCALAGGGWDDRYIQRKLEKRGWKFEGDKAICDECLEKRAEIGESQAAEEVAPVLPQEGRA